MSASIEQEIEQVGKAIARVEREIEEINKILKSPTISDDNKAYYQQEESQIWQKKSQLWQKKDRFLQEKADIRQKKLLLIERTPVPKAAFDMARMAQAFRVVLRQELANLRDKDNTVAFSNVNSTVFNEVMTHLDIEQIAAPWQNRPPCPQCDTIYQWSEDEEDSSMNRKRYMAYLKGLGFPDSVNIFEASKAKELLETDLLPSPGPRMKGNIDQESRHLMKLEASHSEAVYLIKHFLDDPSENDSFLESFLTRAPWDSIIGSVESIQEEKRLAFARSNLDFMDEDERRDEIFRMMLQNPNNRYLSPKMEVGDCSGDGPPKDITLG
ncbi:unnamed protein product [Cylindrotheca closterium]|uniref:Uncharacterized protein n=1 Tax=Cylindrotheca closterium TaxID=2856 RepID=A0AAD2FGY8_9STRA|nr:unnamed protein product [Cylindrotheca closterium]